MSDVRPFRALRPRPDLAARVAAPPYDVINSDEARAMAEGNEISFLHINKPEIDLPPATDPYAPQVYARARENFDRMLAEGVLRRDPEPYYYLYRLVMGPHTQTGIVAAASVAAYDANRIRRHEHTRPDKEDDRAEHVAVLQAHDEPVLLMYPALPAIDALVALQMSVVPAPRLPGRLEKISKPGEPAVFVDYAHSEDALRRVLQNLARFRRGRIITVFGCGGDRDRGKRPLMGRAAARASDLVVVTSDNPRTEDPLAILAAVVRPGRERLRHVVRADHCRSTGAGVDEGRFEGGAQIVRRRRAGSVLRASDLIDPSARRANRASARRRHY